MNKCFRCERNIPEPDFREAIARESDWRHNFAGEDEGRVLICIKCANEIEELDDE